jgi:spore coat protein U-like protein
MSTPSVVSVTAAMLLVFASGLSAQARAAGTASTPIPVSATVSQACSIGTTASLVFGAYDPIGTNATAALNATGQVSVACSKGATGLSIAMNDGAHVLVAQRRMQGTPATEMLLYNIFQPPSNVAGTGCTFPGTTAWTATGAGLLTLAAAPSKEARLYNVCGTIPAGQDATTGVYTDTVIATLNF